MKYLKLSVLLFLPLFSFFSTNVVAFTYTTWAGTIVNGDEISNSEFYSTAMDSSGDIYSVGNISEDDFDFGNGVVVSGINFLSNVLIVKYSGSGRTAKALWAKSVITAPDASKFKSVTVDNSGNVYAAGYIARSDTYSFGPSVSVNGSDNVFNAVLVKYNSSGDVLWAKSVTGSSVTSDATIFEAVTSDSDGNIYAAGWIVGDTSAYDFGNGVVVSGSSTNSSNIVLVKYNSSGEAQWAKSIDGSAPDSSEYKGVKVDGMGDLYAVGNIGTNGTFNLGNNITVSGPNVTDIHSAVLAKYNSTGYAQWAKSVEIGRDNSEFQGVAIDSEGNPIAAGYIHGYGTFIFGDGIYASGPSSDDNLIIIKYNSNGEAVSDRGLIWGDDSKYNSVAASDDAETFYAAGYISGTDTYKFDVGSLKVRAWSWSDNAALVKYSNQPPVALSGGNSLKSKAWTILGAVVLLLH